MDNFVDHWPSACGCGHVLAISGLVADGSPARHQVEELPAITVTVTKHRRQRVRCPDCSGRPRAELPAGIGASAFGPRCAAVAVLCARNRISRRDVWHAILRIAPDRSRGPRQGAAGRYPGDCHVGSLVGLHPPAAQTSPGLLGAPAARLQSARRRLGAEKAFGETGLRTCEEPFWAWEIYQHTGDRSDLKLRIRSLRRQLKAILRTYADKHARHRYTRGMARNLLKIWPALWTFASVTGVKPTTNHAERALRGAVA